MPSPTTGLQIATAVGIFAAGLSAGLNLANPARIDPLYMGALPSGSPTTAKVTPSPSTRLAIWDAQYATGAASVPPFAVSAFLALVAAGKLVGSTAQSGRWIGSRAWYWTAAGLAISMLPFKMLFVKPTNDALFALWRSTSLDTSAAEQNAMQAHLRKWIRLGNIRVALSTAAFGMAIAAAVL